jgi:prepilin-type processing-associated H-X9-DG protein
VILVAPVLLSAVFAAQTRVLVTSLVGDSLVVTEYRSGARPRAILRAPLGIDHSMRVVDDDEMGRIGHRFLLFLSPDRKRFVLPQLTQRGERFTLTLRVYGLDGKPSDTISLRATDVSLYTAMLGWGDRGPALVTRKDSAGVHTVWDRASPGGRDLPAARLPSSLRALMSGGPVQRGDEEYAESPNWVRGHLLVRSELDRQDAWSSLEPLANARLRYTSAEATLKLGKAAPLAFARPAGVSDWSSLRPLSGRWVMLRALGPDRRPEYKDVNSLSNVFYRSRILLYDVPTKRALFECDGISAQAISVGSEPPLAGPTMGSGRYRDLTPIPSPGRHEGSNNLLYLDNHVGKVKRD